MVTAYLGDKPPVDADSSIYFATQAIHATTQLVTPSPPSPIHRTLLSTPKFTKYTMAQTLSGKVAVVSGSSAGIGLAIARELSGRGASVVINYPFPSLSAEAATAVQSLDTQEIAVCADLSTTDGPKQLIETTIREFGKVDILVNNAGRAVQKPF